MKAKGLGLHDFLYQVFALVDELKRPLKRSQAHQQAVTWLLNGGSKHSFIEIFELIYENASHVPYLKADTTIPKSLATPDIPFRSIRHAQPALHGWAIQAVTEFIQKESERMIKPENGLCLRVSSKPLAARKKYTHLLSAAATAETQHTPPEDDEEANGLITWKKINAFSFKSMQATFEENAPVMWHLVNSYADGEYSGKVTSVRKYRPQNVVSTINISIPSSQI